MILGLFQLYASVICVHMYIVSAYCMCCTTTFYTKEEIIKSQILCCWFIGLEVSVSFDKAAVVLTAERITSRRQNKSEIHSHFSSLPFHCSASPYFSLTSRCENLPHLSGRRQDVHSHSMKQSLSIIHSWILAIFPFNTSSWGAVHYCFYITESIGILKSSCRTPNGTIQTIPTNCSHQWFLPSLSSS